MCVITSLAQFKIHFPRALHHEVNAFVGFFPAVRLQVNSKNPAENSRKRKTKNHFSAFTEKEFYLLSELRISFAASEKSNPFSPVEF